MHEIVKFAVEIKLVFGGHQSRHFYDIPGVIYEYLDNFVFSNIRHMHGKTLVGVHQNYF